VIHCAAASDFDERLESALRRNVKATSQLAQLAMQMKHLQSFVHISSAYASSFMVRPVFVSSARTLFI
jgi:alcohol-forming fatty acyl-CoA reductase